MESQYLQGSLNPLNFIKVSLYKHRFAYQHPDYFWPEGLLVFCGAQGSGKTLSAVQYIKKLTYAYPKAILVTNIEIKGLNPETEVIEYDGIDCLKIVENGEYGVIYMIDEIHLEFNSLESKNIDIDIMIEVSQQRKQRKHIVGTSQVYGRLAKPFREQIKNAVLCRKLFGCIQYNNLIDGDKTREENGKLITESAHKYFWIHSPKDYESYDTYAKMRRYRKEWKGRPRKEFYPWM